MNEKPDNIIPFPRSFGMNLEKVEEKCLHYLAEASNPLVPIDTLVEFCKRDPECSGTDRKGVLDFLRHHERVNIMDGPGAGEVIEQKDFTAAGLNMGERAILNTRVPAKEEMTEMLYEQLKDMTDVLVEAMNKAEKAKDTTRIAQLEEALKKSEALRVKMNKLLS